MIHLRPTTAPRLLAILLLPTCGCDRSAPGPGIAAPAAAEAVLEQWRQRLPQDPLVQEMTRQVARYKAARQDGRGAITP